MTSSIAALPSACAVSFTTFPRNSPTSPSPQVAFDDPALAGPHSASGFGKELEMWRGVKKEEGDERSIQQADDQVQELRKRMNRRREQ